MILPAHRNSYDLEGEKVTLRMIPRGGLCAIQNALNADRPDGKELLVGPTGDACPPESPTDGPEASFAALGAPLAAAAVGLAVDLVKKQLEEEAGRYEAKFEARIAEQSFWIRGANGTREPNYDGFEIIRETRSHPEKNPAFRMIFAFVVADDESVFLIRPTYLSERSAKAKVLSKLSVASWFNWFTKAVNDVDVNVNVTFDEMWVDEDKRAHIESVADFPVTVGSVSLEEPRERDVRDLIGKEGGWFPGVRCSVPVDPQEPPQRCGTFWLKVSVTEKDPSNAKKYLTKAAEVVAEKKETIVKVVEERVGGGQ